MRRLRSLLVCPCWRCREAREEERLRPTAEQMRESIERLLAFGYADVAEAQAATLAWRDAINRRADAYPGGVV